MLRPAAPVRALTLCSPLRAAPVGALLGQRPETARRGAGAATAGWVQRRFFSEEVTIALEFGAESVVEGDVETIHFAVGDAVNEGDLLAEIETGKGNQEVRPPFAHSQEAPCPPAPKRLPSHNRRSQIMAPTSGTLTAVLVEEGQEEVPKGQELFKIMPGEGAPAAPAAAPAAASEVTIAAELGGDAVSEGDVETIHFAVGDAVNADDVLAEIETDKVTAEVRPPAPARPQEPPCPAETNPGTTGVRRSRPRHPGR